MLLMGGSVGNILGNIPFVKRFIDREDERLLTICGAAGAIGAIFSSPLGGGIFVTEILYKSSLHYYEIFPAVLSSTMGLIVYSLMVNPEPIFNIPIYLPNHLNVLFFIVAGILAGVVSLVFMLVFQKTEEFAKKFEGKRIKLYLPILGGILTGLIIAFFPEASGTGSRFIQVMLDENKNFIFLIAILIAKILATSFTVGLGGSGGLVIPALFMGAVSGGMISTILASGDNGLSSSLVIVGMAASLASIANVPIAAAIMLIEMVGFQVGIPAVIGSVIGYAIGHSKTIYGTTQCNISDFQVRKDFRKHDRYLE